MSIPSFVLGIVGGTGAGKTTVARMITEKVDDSVTHIPLDDYYRDLVRSVVSQLRPSQTPGAATIGTQVQQTL